MARCLAHFAPGPVHLQAAIWQMNSVIRGGRAAPFTDWAMVKQVNAAYIGCGM
jgi:hypothetical protein